MAFSPFDKESIDDKIKEIDSYAARIDSNLALYKRVHSKSMDCFGWDSYSDSTGVLKSHNYESCFMIDFYYNQDKLVLVTIDGSFKRGCGRTQAPYCWDSKIPRDYKDRIYYDRGKLLKEMESGTRPCCSITPMGYETDSIAFHNKAKIFLKRYGQLKNK